MPRNPRRCSHCRSEDHVITTCIRWETELDLNILGRFQERYNTKLGRRSHPLSKVNPQRLSHVKLLIDGAIPFIIRKFYTKYPDYNLYIIRYENNKLNVSVENPNPVYESAALASIRAHPNTIKAHIDEYQMRIDYYKQACGAYYYVKIENIICILTGDYVELTERNLNDQRVRDAERDRIRLEYQNRAVAVVNQESAVVNRVLLPIIRTIPFEADDCPICLDALGETGNTVLRCGHQLCINCMVTQILRSVVTRNTNMCKCPICRSPYM